MLVVTRSFQGYGYSFRAIGSLIDPPEPARSEIIALGVAVELEVKVMPVPAVTKKKR